MISAFTEADSAAGDNGRTSRIRLALAVIALAFTGIFALTAGTTVAGAAITANPAETFQTRGANPVNIQILASDTDPGVLAYSLVGVDHGGTVDSITPGPDGASATFTPGDGYGGSVTATIKVTNESTLEEVDVNVTINVVPVARLLTGPGVGSEPVLTTTSTPTFTFDATTGLNHGVVSGATFSCRVDNVPKGPCNSGSFTSTSLTEGDHTFSVRATSPDGTNDQFIPVDFTVDTIAPDVPELEGPSGLTNEEDHSWTFSVPEGVALCRLVTPNDADPAWDVCEGPSADYTGLTDGDYTFEVRTRDDAGNVSQVVSKSLEVDTVVDVTIDTAPADGNLEARPSITFSSTEDPAVTYECRIYEASVDAEERPDYEACTSPDELPFLDKNVEYTFDVKVTDPAGNVNDASTTWLQSNTAPSVVEPEETLEAGQAVNLDLGGSDADSDTIEYSIVGTVPGGSLGDIDQDTGVVEFTADADAAGTYLVEYQVDDHRQGGITTGAATVHVQPGTAFVETPGSDVNGETKNQTPTWTFDSPSGVTTFECDLDGAGWVPCDGGSFTPGTDLAEGSHTLEVRAVAEGLYADPTPASSTITVDITAPDVAIDDTPVALSNVAAPTFEYSSTDLTATFECQVDGGTFAPCVSGSAIETLTDGDHTFTVHAVDPSGNIGVDASYDWEADLTKPAIVMTDGLAEADWTNLRKPSWNFTESDLNLIPESTTCTVDDQPVTTDCVGPWQPLYNLNDGMHTLHITSSDAAGNVGTVDIGFRVTTITPTAVVDSGPASPSGPSASFRFVSTTNLGVDGRFECRTNLNGGAYSAWATCAADLELSDLTSGNRTLQVRAVDSAGNYSTGGAVGTWSWNTIASAPDTAISNAVTNGKSAAFAFNSPGNNLASFECQLDAGNWAPCTSPKSYASLASGSHTFSVRAVNQVGTADGSPAAHTWNVDAATAPETNIDRRPSAETAATDAEFEFSSSDAMADFECKLDGADWAACTSPNSLTGLSVGEHTFSVRSSSNGQTDASPASVTWTVKPATVDPTKPAKCKPQKAKASNGKNIRIGKGLKVKVRLSHRNAVVGQKVTATLLINGKKKAKGALRKKALRALKNVQLTNRGAVTVSLTVKKPSVRFTVTDDSPKTNYTVLIKPKKGKAVRTSVGWNLKSCSKA